MRVLDLFCGEGGAAAGYALAGHDVEGVDIVTSMASRYPFRCHSGHALDFLGKYGHKFDLIHASPPCQAYSAATRGNGLIYESLVEPTRAALEATGKPYVIENAIGAPLIDPTLLCWSMFHDPVTDSEHSRPLVMERHRIFETNWLLGSPGPCRHTKGAIVCGAYAGGTKNPSRARGGYVPRKHVLERLMKIEWMSKRGIHQAIPPSYTEYIGTRATEEL
jgi:DNA (cytosine-5)-methyltransferase 1